MSALKTQEGGSHYKDMKIQPMEYSMANSLNACQHTIIKYVSRYKSKNGLEDLKKARHTLDMLIELEYGENAEETIGRLQREFHDRIFMMKAAIAQANESGWGMQNMDKP
jgi:hypothetical protein